MKKRLFHRLLTGWSVLAAVAVVLLFLPSVLGYASSTEQKCSRCRAVRYLDDYVWFKSDRVVANAYSRWYEATQPPHRHHWGWCGSTRFGGLFGGTGCGGPHPVWRITDEQQMTFVKSASPAALKQFYACLDSPDYAMQQKALRLAGVRE